MAERAGMFVQVALPVPRHNLFTYRLPPEMIPLCRPGTALLVPFGRGTRAGVAIRLDAQPEWDGAQIREVEDLLSGEPVLDEALLRLLPWLWDYYLQPPGLVVEAALPAPLERERRLRAVWCAPDKGTTLPGRLGEVAAAIAARGSLSESTLQSRFGRKGLMRCLLALQRQGLIRLDASWKQPDPPPAPTPPAAPGWDNAPRLHPEQQVCVAAVGEALRRGEFAPFLLQGITGSGKTEVYFHAVRQALQAGRGVLILVPEIALTPQLVARFEARFGQTLALLHSGVAPGEKREHWRRLRSGEARVCLGARSALFAPLPNLGLVVVDEEHDSSFKQEEGVIYHGRDMAVVRASQARAVIILGSATPSLESLHNVETGKYTLLTLTERATGHPLPQVEVVDLRTTRKPGLSLLSPRLRQVMEETLARDEQVLLFLNRRGFSPALLCVRCGATVQCPACSVALSFHKAEKKLLCHHCDHVQPPPELCPHCRQLSLLPFGPGSQRLEEECRRAFPEARIARLDRDSVQSGVGVEETLAAFRDRRLDLLLGTQMVAKGHHFPGLALVGVVAAETTLAMPDFRAAERTFQLLSQVAGRAGREGAGQVLVQTFDPDHYAIRTAVAHDLDAFVRQESRHRRQAGFPPFVRAALLAISAVGLPEGEGFLQQLRPLLRELDLSSILGPSPAPIFKVRNRFRWRVLLRDPGAGRLHRALRHLLGRMEEIRTGDVRVGVDVDPQ